MNETAYILHTATEKSLVIMDEVGRGTGAADGLSIAWAVSEDLLDRIKCRTLFATHYHELASLSRPCMANRSMDVREERNEIVFLRRLREGPAAQSYGLHVARLAGLPEKVLERAGEIMEKLSVFPGNSPLSGEVRAKIHVKKGPGYGLLQELGKADPNLLSPLEALKLIHKWKVRFDTETPETRPQKKEPPGEAGRKTLPRTPAAGEPDLFDMQNAP
jgi:DNA mismatch repair protein MutS